MHPTLCTRLQPSRRCAGKLPLSMNDKASAQPAPLRGDCFGSRNCVSFGGEGARTFRSLHTRIGRACFYLRVYGRKEEGGDTPPRIIGPPDRPAFEAILPKGKERRPPGSEQKRPASLKAATSLLHYRSQFRIHRSVPEARQQKRALIRIPPKS